MTLHICTAGTSIAGGPMRKGETLESYGERIETKLTEHRGAGSSKDKDAFLILASAETNGLVRNKAGKGDQVVFLTSETVDGTACGERLVRLVESELGCRARFRQIAGLQVRDGRRFRSLGIASLFDAIENETRDFTPDEVHLNATGGFKGTIPYLVLYGMFNNLNVSYVYEFSESLITLPPLAVEFDWDRIAPAEAAILSIFRDGPIATDRWHDLMPPDYAVNRDRYDPLFEFADDLVGLSAIGHLMKRRLDAAEVQAELLLSPSASAALDHATGGTRAQFEAMLARVRNPLHRSGFRHTESLHTTDLKVWKPAAQQRMLYWIEEARVQVAELFATHDGYERWINARPLQRADYPLQQFDRYQGGRGPDYDALLRDIQASNAEPIERARRLEDELQEAKLEIQRLRTARNAELRREREQADARGYAAGRREAERAAQAAIDLAEVSRQATVEAWRDTVRDRDAQIARLEEHVARLEGTLAAMKKDPDQGRADQA